MLEMNFKHKNRIPVKCLEEKSRNSTRSRIKTLLLLTQQQWHPLSTMERFTFPSRISRERKKRRETRIRGEVRGSWCISVGPKREELVRPKRNPSRFSANTCNCLLTPFLAHSARESKRRRDRPTLGNKRRRFSPSFPSFLFFFLPSLSLPFPSNAAKHHRVWILKSVFFLSLSLSSIPRFRLRLSREMILINSKRNNLFFSPCVYLWLK